jgi:hypothetical protein
MTVKVYNRIIRKLTLAFGNIFNNLTLVRYNLDLTEQERFLIPVGYGTKELYVSRLQEDPDLNKKVQITLPRISYILNGISYDNTRKQNTNLNSFSSNADGTASQYNFVPYNFDFSLYLYVRNIDDGLQVMEKIIPYFTPDFTIKLNLIPELGISKDIPIVLKDTNYEVVYEGNSQSDTRMVIWTLDFNLKGYLFTSAEKKELIQNSITNILLESDATTIHFIMSSGDNGKYIEDEIVYQGYSLDSAIATAKVLQYNVQSNKLTVTNVRGNFVTGKSIVGSSSGAKHTLISYQVSPVNASQIIITPTPTDANVNTVFGYTTSINEAPNIDTNVLTTYNFFGDLMNNSFGTDDWLREVANSIDLGSDF